MKNKIFVLIIGESTGLECLKVALKKKYFKISHVISVDKKYNEVIFKLCKLNRISFLTSEQFKKKTKKITFKKENKHYLISIFSNLILKSNFLKKFHGRAYNFHPGLLPFYPGKNCVSGALYNNEKKTGISLHFIKQKVDTGAIIRRKLVQINNQDNLMTLMLKLKNNCIIIFKKFLNDLYHEKKFQKIKNNIKLKKKFPKFIPFDGQINENLNFVEFKNLYKASFFGPYKNSWGNLTFKFKNFRKKIISIEKITIKKKPTLLFVEKINKKKYKINFKNKTVLVNV